MFPPIPLSFRLNPKLISALGSGPALFMFDLGLGGWFSLQLDSDDLLDAPVEAQSAFYEGPGVSRWPLYITYTAGAEEEAEAGGQAWAERGAEAGCL